MAEIMAATAVGWVVSPVIRLVISKTQTFIENKYFEKSGIEDDMKKMSTTLVEIRSIMGTVEKQRIVDPNEVQLAREIKDAVYDAEDVVDEFEYNLLKEKSEKQQKKVRHVAASCSRVIHWAIVGNYSFKKKVKEVRESVDRAKRSAETLLQLMNTKNACNIQFPEKDSQLLTSSIISEEIIGRENERALLINLLFEKVEQSPTIIAIIGQGGLGKTTLAQMVFNDPRVTNNFDQTIWITVSDNFDKFELTKQMLKDVCENFSTTDASFNKLQKKFETEVASKKILLMLDDVWYVKDDNKKFNYEKGWLELLAPLKNAKQGSKIIVTTRQDLVVSSLALFGSVKTISLDGLNDDASWSLFKLNAFDGENLDNLHDLEHIGKKIVKKLKGLALAIRVVGMELRGKSDIEEWKRILNDNSLNNGDIMDILYRSYEHLPEHLQRCFAYCSLFPKDYYLKPDRLIHMWIAHGFVHPQEGKLSEKEKIAQSYFNELIARSFIQVIKQSNKKYYVMHDLMNDLACHVSKGECCILEKGDTMKNLGSIRHLSVTPGAFNIIKDIIGFDKLRTVIFLSCGQRSIFNLIDESFIKLKRIRVLDIEWQLKSVPNVAKCKHLRYLCFRECNYKLAPNNFNKLHHLVVLFIRKRPFHHMGVYHRLTLPWSICSISSLVFIDVSKSFEVDVGEWVQLHNLLVGGSVFVHVKKGWELGLLRGINNIQGCVDIVGLENVVSGEEVIEAQLGSKEHVTELRLLWLNSSSEVKSNKQHEVLEALGPNQSIERLKICGYQGDVSPSWLESKFLSRIKEIYLTRCNGLKMLPALGQLPQLKKLHIESINGVNKIGLEFYGNSTFPSLEDIVIADMMSLEEWSFPCGFQSFPKLHKLLIRNCPRFVGLEWDGFLALKKLIIDGCDALILKAKLKEYGCLLTLTELTIADCEGIITLGGWPELVTLKSLRIKHCPNLFSLPEMEFYYSLEELEINNCRKLRSLPKKGLPISLKKILIIGSHDDLKDQIRSKNGREWDKVAAISECDCVISQYNVIYGCCTV